MSFKTKVVAFLAGSALALSLTTGAMAQSGTTVELEDNATGCGASLTGASVDFGSYTWNGSAYTFNNDANGTTLTATVTDGRHTSTGCDVEFSAGNMTVGGSGTGDSIAVQYAYNSGTPINPLTVEDAAVGDVSVEASISSTIDGSYDPAVYSGTVQVDANNAS